MQTYHPSNKQQYYTQAQYPPQPVYYATYPSSYNPHYPHQPAQPAQPFPKTYPADQYDTEDHSGQHYPVTPNGRSKQLGRSQSAQVARSNYREPKSIMKRNHERSTSANVVPPVSDPPISRSRSNSNARPASRPPSRGRQDSSSRASSRAPSQTRTRANSSTRPQLDPAPSFVPDHVFLSLHGTNEIRIENIAYQDFIEDLRDNLLPMWPYGVAWEESRHHRWRAQFSGNPWSSTGGDGLLARRMICRLFAVLSNQGYSYLSTMNTSSSSSRLVFATTERQPLAAFFSISVSQSGDKISVLDGPPWLVHHLGKSVRDAFPRRVASDSTSEDGVCIIELKRGSDTDKSLFAAYILQYFRAQGFKLNGSFPLGKSKSPLSFGAKKEVWILKGAVRLSESIKGRE